MFEEADDQHCLGRWHQLWHWKVAHLACACVRANERKNKRTNEVFTDPGRLVEPQVQSLSSPQARPPLGSYILSTSSSLLSRDPAPACSYIPSSFSLPLLCSTAVAKLYYRPDFEHQSRHLLDHIAHNPGWRLFVDAICLS